MVKSIRWRIQLWHSAVLLLVVECFAALLYFRLEQTKYDAIDSELEGAGQLLVSVLQSIPPPELERRGRLGDSPPPEAGPDERRPPPRHAGPPGRGPRGGGIREGEPRAWDRHYDQMRRFEQSLDIPLALRVRYGEQGSDSPYFAVWKGSGELLKASSGAAQLRLPADSEFAAAGVTAWRRRGDLREALFVGPVGTHIVVGRNIRAELYDLRQWLLLLVAAGVGLVALGIVGGTVLSYGSLGSIRAMSATAAGISERNLAERIDTRQIDSELRELADTLNSAFARLEHSFARQAQFTADASHELRTPLTVVLGNLELALSQPDLNPATRESLDASLRAARRMRALVDHLLVLARADAGMLELDRQAFDLEGTVEECVELLRPLASKRAVELRVTGRPAEVCGDPRLIAQVVINLVTNAIQYNREGGRVDVSVTERARDVEIVVADTGVGIPESAREHLFERFYRVDKTRSRESGGTGLGLSITKSIVAAHGGSIEVDSELELGTTIRVRFPRAGELLLATESPRINGL